MQACNDAAFSLLCELVEASHGEVHPDAIRFSGCQEAYARLLELRALQMAGVADGILCPWCGGEELHSLCFKEGRHQGYCGECGWQRLTSCQISSLRVDHTRIARWLGSALGLQGRFRVEEVAPDHLWRLGEIEHRRKRHSVFFGRRLDDAAQAQAIDGGLRAVAAPGSEILITTTSLESIAPSFSALHVVPLRAIAHLRKAGFVTENLESYLDLPRSVERDVAETSLRLLHSGRGVSIDGKQVKVSPQVARFLSVLIDAEGKAVHKRTLADALEIDVDACKGSEIFKRHKAVYQTFVDHDDEGRYWIKSEFLNTPGGD